MIVQYNIERESQAARQNVPSAPGPLSERAANKARIAAALGAARQGESTTLRVQWRAWTSSAQATRAVATIQLGRGEQIALLAESGRHEPCCLDEPHRGIMHERTRRVTPVRWLEDGRNGYGDVPWEAACSIPGQRGP